MDDGEPTLTKFIFRLERNQIDLSMFQRTLGAGNDIPEGPFSSDAEVLKDEPDSHIVIRIGELKGAHAKATNEIPGEHAAGG